MFGEGSVRSKVMFTGEQPGLPFVGPAGARLRKTMSQAGIDW
ncbi:MAG TPA: uracil-DNA glycosylase family protein [Candidatus Baltobacteraceae bacterium]|nr:uracil-DNA glycosylase family protein [Candidatus Baltobacteraceae bacterium]